MVAHRGAGFEVAGWPPRSEKDPQLALTLGVNTFTTDIPSQLIGKLKKP
jgi:hypothetical protein